ncbi:MAG: hypothetical protein IJ088_10050 [Clostridia bacterium]|nr:hypothetical protein [Clostridia bacterium]
MCNTTFSEQINSPEEREPAWRRRLAQLDYRSQIDSAWREGYAEGYAEGIAKGADRLATLMTKLYALEKMEDVVKAAKDKAYRNKLFAQYGIKQVDGLT